MRTEHKLHTLPNFPIYSIGFVSDTKAILGGGGGTGRSGIKNKLRLYEVEGKGNETQLKLLDESELEQDEDAPMTLAVAPPSSAHAGEFVCGVNSSTEKMSKGDNEHCRAYSTANDEVSLLRRTQTLRSDNAEDYQKATAFGKDGSLIAVGTTNREVQLLEYPSLKRAAQPWSIPTGDISDLDFGDKQLLVASSTNLFVIPFPSKKTEKDEPEPEWEAVGTALPTKEGRALAVEKVIERPETESGVTGTFRAAKFNPQSDRTAYTVLNTTPLRKSNSKGERKAYIHVFEIAESGAWAVKKHLMVSPRPITVFDVSANGKLLAYGSSDCSVGILDAKNLTRLLTILKSHDFPPTALRFNGGSNLLMAASADSSVRAITVPDKLNGSSGGGSRVTTVWVIVLTLLALVLALLMPWR